MVGRGLAAAAVVAFALGCAACGGTTEHATDQPGSVPESASFVPASEAAYFAALAPDRRHDVEQLAARFPDEKKLYGKLVSALAGAGVDWNELTDALGTELGAAEVLASDSAQTIAAAKADPARVDAILAAVRAKHGEAGIVTRTVDGWVVASGTKVGLDAAEKAHAGGHSLADDADFRTLMSDLPGDALIRMYTASPEFGADGISSATITATASASAASAQAEAEARKAAGASAPPTTVPESDGVLVPTETLPQTATATFTEQKGHLAHTAIGLSLHADTVQLDTVSKGEKPPHGADYAPALPSQIPADAFAYLSFDGDSSQLTSGSTLPLVPLTLFFTTSLFDGVSGPEDDPVDLGHGESALYARPGSPLPEVTLVLPASALAGIKKRIRKLAANQEPESVTVAGIPAKRVTIRRVPVYYAAFDGKVVVTDSLTGIEGLKDGGPKLADDDRYHSALEAAGVPDEVGGLAYVDAARAVPALAPLASALGQDLPSWFEPNVKVVDTVVGYAARDGDLARTSVVVGVR